MLSKGPTDSADDQVCKDAFLSTVCFFDVTGWGGYEMEKAFIGANSLRQYSISCV